MVGGGSRRLSAVRPDRLTAWLAAQQKEGLTDRTVNHYLEAAVAFCNWCVAQRRLETNPLLGITKAAECDPKEPTRAATLDDLGRLLRAARRGRSLVYLTVSLTGLRRKELSLLEWGTSSSTLRLRILRCGLGPPKAGGLADG